jgi:hypothetical protein
MIDKAKLKSAILSRLGEPSTYAGLSALFLSGAEIAEHAHEVTTAFKQDGRILGTVALVTSIGAIIKGERKHKKDDIIDTEYTVVSEEKTPHG